MIVKDTNEFSRQEQLWLALYKTSFAVRRTWLNKEKYMKIISLLKRLRYRMNELRTYLYKDVIVEVYKLLEINSNRDDMNKHKEMLSQLNGAFSSLYYNIEKSLRV